MALGTILWIITIVMCLVFLYVSLRFRGEANVSFSHYSIGGGTFPIMLILFTQFTTIMGVGNFVGHAAHGYSVGLPHLAFIAGEQGSKIVFALLVAGLAGRFTYNTFTEMIDDLFVRDKVTRAMGGLLATSIMIAWVGGQGKAFGQIFHVVSGANPVPVILFFSAIFIVYTALAGIYSVVWTDLIQGILVVVFGVIFYIIAFQPVGWSMAELGSRLAAVGRAELWSFSNVPVLQLVTSFVIGTIGIFAAQIYWQRCFAAKDGKTARNGLLISGIGAIIMVMLTALVGMVILTLNPDLNPNDAMPWFLMHYVPTFVAAMIFMLVLVAGMSSADSNLNSAAVLIVNDLVKPFRPSLTEKQLVNWAKILTVLVGIFAAVAALYAESIIGLFSKAYAMAGGGLVPLLLVGFLWKENPSQPWEMGKVNSKVTPWGARIGILSGAVLTQIEALGPNRVIWALLVSMVLIIVVSALTRASSSTASKAA